MTLIERLLWAAIILGAGFDQSKYFSIVFALYLIYGVLVCIQEKIDNE